jgi:hypothetical protein
MVSSIKNRIAAFEHLASTSKSQSNILEIVPPSPGFSVTQPKKWNVRAKETSRVVPELPKRINSVQHRIQQANTNANINNNSRSKEDDIETYNQFRKKKIQIASNGNNLQSTQPISKETRNEMDSSIPEEEKERETPSSIEDSNIGNTKNGEQRDVPVEVSKKEIESDTRDFDETGIEQESDRHTTHIDEIRNTSGPKEPVDDNHAEVIIDPGQDDKDYDHEESEEEEEGPVSIIEVESKDQSREEEEEEEEGHNHSDRDEQSVSPLSFLEHKIHNLDDNRLVPNVGHVLSSIPEPFGQSEEANLNEQHYLMEGETSNAAEEWQHYLSPNTSSMSQSETNGGDEERDQMNNLQQQISQNNFNQHNTSSHDMREGKFYS